jgi:methylated-DNA-[protein]-cysteine S-methyltransferase
VTLSRTRLESPVGRLDLVASDDALVAVLWERDRPDRVRLEPLVEAVDHPILEMTARQLGEYFAGGRTVFDIPLEFRGPAFQKSVWQALLTIPFGETRTYGQIAQQIGRPTASRAVGAANGANPISIIAPCHRVIGADGSLTGFAGGMENKRLLLNLEGARHARQDDLFS